MNRRTWLRSTGQWAGALLVIPSMNRMEGVLQSPPIVETAAGRIRGAVNNGIYAFKGVPYGADTAARRFQIPIPPTPWSGVRDALTLGPTAPQAGRREPVSEDCLHLNVWTPGLNDAARRPVMVWFHGGAYSGGTSNEPETDGEALSRRGDVVVVTVNHRLNAFGYLSLAAWGGDDLADSGNVGMLDLILALQWVRDHAGRFGGDPSRVTVFGHSGGGAKIATLMAMPASKGLFHRAITMSGQQVTASRPETALKHATALIDALQISPRDVDRLRTLPMDALIKVARVPPYLGPVKDGRSLPRDPFDPDAPPQSAHIPMILGNTRGETRTLIGRGNAALFDLTWETLQPALEAQSPFMGTLDRGEVIRMYRRLYPHYSAPDVFFAATTDSRSWRGQVIEADRRAAQPAGAAPTWVYQLDWHSPAEGGRWGAHHGLDVPLTFGTLDPDRASGRRLSDVMSDTFITFARTGRPAASALPEWPAFDLALRRTMIFDTTSRVMPDPRGEERRYFGKVPYVQPGT